MPRFWYPELDRSDHNSLSCDTVSTIPKTREIPSIIKHNPKTEQFLTEVRAGAESGSVNDQYILGLAYTNKEVGTVTTRLIGAARWFRKAADQGHPDAQYRLGLLYYKGIGVVQSRDKAISWLLKAANQGDSDAKYCVMLIDSGHEIPENPSAARNAAEYIRSGEGGGLGSEATFNSQLKTGYARFARDQRDSNPD